MYEDKTLECVDCSKEFTFTAGEQEFFATKGFDGAPLRCKECRDAKKQARRSNREMHEVTCADCGKTCQVPFLPKGDKPVYCSECYEKHQNA